MNSTSYDYSTDLLPVYQKNHRGEKRKVGFEVEYVGIGIEESIQLLKELFSGDIHRINKNEYILSDSRLGQFKVERDARVLKKMASQSEQNKKENKIDIPGYLEEAISATLKNVIPLEIITPPVYIECIPALDALIEALQQHHALGTNSSSIAAFGVHINPDVPSLAVHSILSYMKAYTLLDDWLRRDIQIDITRILLPFIQEYPKGYKKKILHPDYSPSMDTLINDYIRYNPTRNRALDMLPFFSFINSAAIRQKMRTTLIQARPTFHYRLANSNLDVSSWNLSIEWKRWLLIERLAANPTLQKILAEKFLNLQNGSFFFDKKQWIKIVSDTIQIL